MNSPWLGIALIIGILALLTGGLALCRKRFSLSGEWSRKIVHIIMGLCCLSFPWLFHTQWPVMLLGVLSLVILLWLRARKSDLHEVLHGVQRTSYGELLFPLSVMLLFLLMKQPVTDYLIPVLVLTLADAVGALVGLRYGLSRFSTDEGHKSLEGSIAFFMVSYVSTHIPLLLLTDIGRVQCMLIAILISLLVMLLEAIAWRGLDNLFIPLGTYLLLQNYITLDTMDLWLRLLVLIGLMVLLFILRKRTYAHDSTLMAGVILLYLIWIVGGWLWLLAPVALLAGYSWLCPPQFRSIHHPHGLHDLGAVAGMGFVWIFLATAIPEYNFYWAYTLSWATQLTMIACAYRIWLNPEIRFSVMLAQTLLISGGLYIIPLFAAANPMNGLAHALLLLLACTIACSVYWKLEWIRYRSTRSPGRAGRQFLYGAIASCLGLIPITLQ